MSHAAAFPIARRTPFLCRYFFLFAPAARIVGVLNKEWNKYGRWADMTILCSSTGVLENLKFSIKNRVAPLLLQDPQL